MAPSTRKALSRLIVRYRVEPQIPFPARTTLHCVQAALSLNRVAALRLIHDGAVACQGRPILQAHLRVQVGDILEIEYSPQPSKPAPKKSARNRKRGSSPLRFEVVHDDEDILVVNKPAGLLTVPTPRGEKNTLRSQVDHWLQKHQRRDQGCVLVQRLDRGVSGLLVLAKHDAAAQALRSQFAGRKPKRVYVAIVRGHFTPRQTVFKSYLTTDPKSLNRYSVKDPGQGELAITHARVKEYWDDLTLLHLQLETGRRNQIRVHVAEAGHPIIGDPRYRPRDAEHPLWPHRRIALHAQSLEFLHPTSGEEFAFEASWPQEFRDLRRKASKSKPKDI